MSSYKVTVHIDDNSPEILAALRNAVERAALVMGAKAATYAADNLERQDAVDTGRLKNSITFMVKEE